MSGKVYAGIVTYNPDICKLIKNIKAIKEQVDKVIIVDNNSNNIDDIIQYAHDCIIICNSENKGIAEALNQIMQYSYEKNVQWCVTLDQDSVCPKELIESARELMLERNVGQIVPQIKDVSTGEVPMLDSKANNQEYQVVKKCITSASITNVKIWKCIGGFDKELFIDYVDFDYSVRLRNAGYKIIRMNKVYLEHELGESVYRRLFLKKVRVANHSAFRKYYICRNIVIYIRRYYKNISVLSEILRICKTILFSILYEEDKKKKVYSCIKGIKDGILFKIKR